MLNRDGKNDNFAVCESRFPDDSMYGLFRSGGMNGSGFERCHIGWRYYMRVYKVRIMWSHGTLSLNYI